MPEPLLKLAEVALLLRVSKETVRSMLRRGALPSIRLAPRTLRIPTAAVERLLADVEVPQAGRRSRSRSPNASEGKSPLGRAGTTVDYAAADLSRRRVAVSGDGAGSARNGESETVERTPPRVNRGRNG